MMNMKVRSDFILNKSHTSNSLGHVKLQKQIDVKEFCSHLAFRALDHFLKEKKNFNQIGHHALFI